MSNRAIPSSSSLLFSVTLCSLVLCGIGTHVSWAQGNPSGGDGGGPTPTWVSPGSDPFEGPVIVSVAPNRGDWMVSGVGFECRELAVEGGHGDAPWAQCLPQGAAVSMGENLWGKQWNPCANAYGHDGSWELKATVSYFKMMPYTTTQKTIYKTVTLADIAILSATCDAAVPGIPADARVIGVDPGAAGGPYRNPTFTWSIRTARPPGDVIFNLRIADVITGQDVRVIPRSSIPNFALDGSYEWDPSQPPGQAVPRGVYSWSIGVVKGTLGPSDGTRSSLLQAGNVWAQPGNYDAQGGKLPVEMHVTFTDVGGVPPSAAAVYVVNASPNNTDVFSVAGGGADLDLTLGAQTKNLELDPLDGYPYYLVVYSKDDHGGLAGAEDRQHEDRPALPRSVKLVYAVTQMWPNQDGRVYISDHWPVPGERYSDVPLLNDATKCQSADHQALARARATLSAIDTIPSNDATTMNLNTGGVWVYFHGLDPDSGVLWDPNGDQGNDNDDDTRSMSPGYAVAVPSGAPTDPALAESTLTFTDHAAGSNYRVSGTPFEDPHTEAAYTSKLEAWKIVYYELDKMPGLCSAVIEAGDAGDSTIAVARALDLYAMPGVSVVIFDTQHHDLGDAAVAYEVAWVEGPIEGPNTLHLTVPLRYPVNGGTVAHPDGAVMRADSWFYEGIDLGKMAEGYDTQCVRFAQLPETLLHAAGPGYGIVPKYSGDWFPPLQYFDHPDIPNVIELIGARWGGSGAPGLYGLTIASERRTLVCRQRGDPPADCTPLQLQGTLVHEVGHIFGQHDFQFNHPGHRNYVPNDGCVMIYGVPPPHDDWNDSPVLEPELFGGEAGSGSAYQDLREIAIYPDPLPS